MKIHSITYNACCPSFGGGNSDSSKKLIDRVFQHIFDKLPEIELKETPKIKGIIQTLDEKISKPMQNRLIMGGTAILTQPFIDYHNHKVDDETRTIAKNRTIAKIITGTAVGAIVRDASYRIIENMTQIGGTGKYSQKLLPKSFIEEFTQNAKYLKNYRSALATSIALGVMLFTNFLLDAPITRWLTNRFNANDKKLKSINQQKQLQQEQQMQQLRLMQRLQQIQQIQQMQQYQLQQLQAAQGRRFIAYA